MERPLSMCILQTVLIIVQVHINIFQSSHSLEMISFGCLIIWILEGESTQFHLMYLILVSFLIGAAITTKLCPV